MALRRRADGPAVAAHERLQCGRGVHVGDRDDPLDVGDSGDRLPRLLDRVDVGHVGHRAAGVEVGEDHLLVVAGEDVGRFGHEVDAAEHDVLGRRRCRRPCGTGRSESPRHVGPAHHLVALVVVAEDHQTRRRAWPWPRRSDRRARRVWPWCSARGAGSGAGALCCVTSRGRALRLMAGGDSLVAHPRGCRPRSGYVAGYQAGVR